MKLIFVCVSCEFCLIYDYMYCRLRCDFCLCVCVVSTHNTHCGTPGDTCPLSLVTSLSQIIYICVTVYFYSVIIIGQHWQQVTLFCAVKSTEALWFNLVIQRTDS